MNIHILDFIMYILCIIIIWRYVLSEDYKEELGALVGLFISAAFTVVYLILFAIYPDWNWIDLFKGLGNYFTTIKFGL